MNSLVHIRLNDEGKIQHFEDRWSVPPLPLSQTSKLIARVLG